MMLDEKEEERSSRNVGDRRVFVLDRKLGDMFGSE